MTTPTPRTDAERRRITAISAHAVIGMADKYGFIHVVPADFARQLERELAALQSDLTRRDTLLGMIRAYPYIPQGLASLIDREVAGWGGKG